MTDKDDKTEIDENVNSSDLMEDIVTDSDEQKQAEQDAKEMLEKYDKESQFREKIGKWAWVVTFLGVSLTIFHLYVGYFGTLPSQKQGAVHLGTGLGLIFLLYPIKRDLKKKQNIIPWNDV